MAFNFLARLAAATALALACAQPIAAQEPGLDDGGAPAADADPGHYDIIVRVVAGEPPAGTVEISLFNSAENFLKQPYLQTSGPINEDGSYTARFGKVPPGDYAIVVVHDENDNGKLDAGFLGFGGEGYAFSNDVKPLFGRPGFDEVKFGVSTRTQIEIRLD